MAGCTPFDGGMTPVSARVNAASPSVADFGELGQVLKRYDAVAGTFRGSASAANANSTLTSSRVRQFIDNFDRVKALLAPLYPSDDGAATGYDVSIEFRVNRGAEIAANQMIDWTLTSGSQSISMNDAPHLLHWDYGTPVSLTLRFAKDSPLAAAADPQQQAYTTDGRTLTWQFSDPWALISFINHQRVADTAPRGDHAAQLLRFEYPLGTANPADLSFLPKQARGRVYVRMTLMPAGKKTPLPWPGTFPARAPEWSAL
jgi:type VI secretion system protein ImpL